MVHTQPIQIALPNDGALIITSAATPQPQRGTVERLAEWTRALRCTHPEMVAHISTCRDCDPSLCDAAREILERVG